MTRRYWIEQLAQHIRQSDLVAQRAERDAREAAVTLSTAAEQKDDGRAALEFGALSSGQSARAFAAQQDMQALTRFCNAGVPDYHRRAQIGLGAIVDIATEDLEGEEERTFILLPVGAGTQLEGPGGDGFLTVITPASPVGRALMGKQVGDVVDVTVRGEPVEWAVVDVG